MNSFRKFLATTTLIGAVSFAGAAFAEGEYQYTAPVGLSTNAVGGGRVVVVNTGNPDNAVAVIHLDNVGEQRPVGGRIATISTQDMYQPSYVEPAQVQSSPTFLTTLGELLFGGRARG